MKYLILLHALWSLPSFLSGQSYPRYSVVIHEIFPDPSPSVGLPSSEFVELRNRSSIVVNLKNWKLTDGSSVATISTDILLSPDSMIILCAVAYQAQWSAYGRAMGLSNFPTLNNEGDQLSLIGPDNNTVHAVGYDISWYKSSVKAIGGWTIEMIDTHYPCMGSENWKASTDPKGGTPGNKNAVQSTQSDNRPPRPIRSVTVDPQQVIIYFNEPIDSSTIQHLMRFSIDPALLISSVKQEPPFFESVRIVFSTAMQPNTIYTCTIQDIIDCSGNKMDEPVKIPIGVPSPVLKGDIIFNELLFNPKPGKYDFVELYNRSKHIIDMRELYIGNKSLTGTILNPGQISRSPYYLFPGSYLVLTEDASMQTSEYSSTDSSLLLQGSVLPSMPDDRGTLALSTGNGTMIETMEYDESWHFPLLSDKEGVSLERIDPMAETQEKNNWTSAASLSGFATPGRKNSQFKNVHIKEAQVYIEPVAFSPDNDGINDLLGIHYSMNDPGYLMQIRIYDIQGRLVAHPIQQATLPQKGSIWWNGMGSSNNLLSPGNYIVWVELIKTDGKVAHFKFCATLNRRY